MICEFGIKRTELGHEFISSKSNRQMNLFKER